MSSRMREHHIRFDIVDDLLAIRRLKAVGPWVNRVVRVDELVIISAF